MKTLFRYYFVLIAVLLVLFGCSDPSGSSDMDYPPPPPGSGYFFFTLDTVNMGRTILPVTVQTDFLAYDLDFCTAGTTTPVIKNESRTNANLSSPVTLNVGTYDLFITAYMDAAKTKPAAKAALLSIAISNSVPYTGSVSLKEIAVGGQGTFSWNITSSGVTLIKAAMDIKPLDAGGTPAQTVNLITNSNSSAALNSGYYRVVIHLDNNKGECAERTEILHVYQNMNSNFIYSFKAGEFHFIRVVEVNFANTTETVNLCNLVGNDVYLVKVNTAETTPLNILAAETGRVISSTPNPSSGPILPDGNQNPSPLPIGSPKWTMGRPYGEAEYPVSKNDSNSSSSPNPGIVPPPYAINQVIQFWLEVSGTSSPPTYTETLYGSGYFEERNATLVYSGNYCNVWVLNENYGGDTTTGIRSPYQIDITRAQQIAGIFDNIYPKETTLLGYENGGGPGGNGGLDGDIKVQILVYDLNGGNTAGFFWSKDFNPYGYGGGGQKSNQKEMVYVDANVLINDPPFTTSLLVHEFQHLIGYSVKRNNGGLSSAFSGWYTEMLSLMTEDIINPLVGITPGASYSSSGHPIDGRLWYFMYAYEPKDEGVNEWQCEYRYENKFAFGAYLLRNFGGAELLRRISQNSYVGEQSIAEALKDWFNDNGNPKFNADSTAAFRYAVERYGEALLFGGTAPDGVLSFNKTAPAYTITGDYGSFTYTTIPFDIWGNRWSNVSPQNGWSIKGMRNIYGVADGNRKDMRRSSVSLHTSTGWKNVTGNFSVTLQQPTNTNIKMYLMVK